MCCFMSNGTLDLQVGRYPPSMAIASVTLANNPHCALMIIGL